MFRKRSPPPLSACLQDKRDQHKRDQHEGSGLDWRLTLGAIAGQVEFRDHRKACPESQRGRGEHPSHELVHRLLRRDGLGLLNRGTHEVDEMRFILGDPVPLWLIGQASRKTDKWERRVRCEDLCFGEICFDGGIRGIYESDLPGPGLRGDAVYGDDGQLRRGPDGTIELLNSQTAGWQTIKPRQSEPNQYEEMIQWLDDDIEQHRNAGIHGKITIEILMAIYESVRINDVVEFPLETRPNPLDLMVEGGLMPVFKEGRYDIRAPFPEEK